MLLFEGKKKKNFITLNVYTDCQVILDIRDIKGQKKNARIFRIGKT